MHKSEIPNVRTALLTETFDGQLVGFASGDQLPAFDPVSGKTVRPIDVAAHAGTAFDGKHLFQIAEDRIHKIDPRTGKVLATIPAPSGGGNSGLAWAEGSLWVGQYRDRKTHQIDPNSGAIARAISLVVTGVTWIDGELWHGTWEGDESDLRRINPKRLKSSRSLIGRPARAYRDLSPIAATGSSAAAEAAARCERCAGRGEL